jgi:acylphosphatase
MMMHTEIIFKRKSYEDGFGFDCMKAAYLFGITGRMDYGPEVGVRIEAEGEESRITKFIKWIETNGKNSDNMLYTNSSEYDGKFKEFDIFRHSDFTLK